MVVRSSADVLRALHTLGLERDRMRAALARELGLPLNDLDALEHLELAGALSQRELADRLALTSGAVTQLVDRLERKMLAVRRPHPNDRRVTNVELVPAAESAPFPALDHYHQALSDAAQALTGTQRAALHHFLATVTEAAQRAAIELRNHPPRPGPEPPS